MTAPLPRTLPVVDTHTGGEPTRVVLDPAGDRFPALAAGTAADRRAVFAGNFDALRRAVVLEPRGHAAVVAAFVLPPASAGSVAAVVFCNNRGALRMCGHGTAGVAVALRHAGLIEPGTHSIDTPAGPVSFTLHEDGHAVSLTNVPSLRQRTGVELTLPATEHLPERTARGEIAWGGNWFFLTPSPVPLNARNRHRAHFEAERVRDALLETGDTGRNGELIDHIELTGPPTNPANDGRNFVLCPGGEYDRSPCGTGTSAKLACLAADGKLAPGEVWRQEGVLGSVFEASYERGEGDTIVPTLTMTAFVTGENTLHFDPADPFVGGIS